MKENADRGPGSRTPARPTQSPGVVAALSAEEPHVPLPGTLPVHLLLQHRAGRPRGFRAPASLQ